MHYIVCTLYEKNYHLGVAALINSLERNGFTGAFYIGYRGVLPSWANDKLTESILPDYEESYSMVVSNINIYFLKLNTDFHLANYKPFFMKEVWRFAVSEAKGIFYFDPDIVLKTSWAFLGEWVSLGVALVHDITANDMPVSHPVRLKWAEIIKCSNRSVRNQICSYINSGFCGVSMSNIKFIDIWIDIMNLAISKYDLKPNQFEHAKDRANPFFAHDQDALNIAAMCSDLPISEYGPEAMDLINGGKVMSHATGSPKPWSKSFLIKAMQGNPPSLAEKEYWKYANGIIQPYSNLKVSYEKFCIKVASFIGRFYKKY